MKRGNENKYASKFKKFTHEECAEQSKKYETLADFRENEPDMYRYSTNKKWTKDFTWLSKYNHRKLKYTYEECYEDAKKYKTLKDYHKSNNQKYHYALNQGWLKDYTWLERIYKVTKEKRDDSHFFTYDECYDAAKKYTTIRDFIKGNKKEYTSARNHKWLEDYYWLTDNRIGKTDYITYEYCYELANKCFSRTEMRYKNRLAFSVAKNNGWLNDYTWFHSVERATNKVFLVYAYEEESTKTVYIGLTNDLRRRHRQHLNYIPHTKKYDTVKTYFDSINIPLGMPKVLISGLTGEEAQYYEGKYCTEYEGNGWTLLNKAMTGVGSSSVGIYITKWTYDVCYEIAKKYSKRNDFYKYDNLAYQAASRNGWLDKFDNFQPSNEKYLHKRRKETSVRHGKVSICDKTGQIIKVFDSCAELAKELGVTRSAIYCALHNGKYKVKGYIIKEIFDE